MPRFFFDFRQGDDCCPDDQGTEFPNVERAYLEAYQCAQEMWSVLLKQRRDPRRCHFEVRNAERDLLFVFPFQEVMDSCQERKSQPLARTFHDIRATHSYVRRVSADFHREMHAIHARLQESRALLTEES